MKRYFPNKRIFGQPDVSKSMRLRGWDYASNGHYFITIVTAHRRKLFGYIENGKMILNDFGQIVHDEFFRSFEIRKELSPGAFVLMPDHLHAIITLKKIETEGAVVSSISSFVAGFKSATIKHIDDYIDSKSIKTAKFNKHNPLWQSNYYDREGV